ncbi:lipopolysaccharide biosynthesis protein, partial [Clostridium tarantellae]
IIAIIVDKDVWFQKKRNYKLKTNKKQIIEYGTPLVLAMIITWIFQSIDKITINKFCGYEEVGIYSGAMSIIVLLSAFQSTFTTVWIPIAFERYSINPNDKNFFVKVNKLVSLIMLVISIIILACKDIIIILLGNSYRQAVFIFPCLLFMPIMYTISETTVLGINFKNKSRNHIYISIIAAGFNILGNILLVPKLGAKGAAISTSIAYIIFFILRTYIANKYYKISFAIKEFSISIFFIYILAIYSSFNKFNFNILILIIICLLIVFFQYKNIIKVSFNIIKNKLFYKLNNKSEL